MKIYVTGASGFIGQRIVKQLVAAGHTAIALSRDPSRIATSDGIEARPVDLEQLDTILPVIEDCDAGIHAAGIGPHADAKQQQVTNVQASRHLAAAAKRKKSLRRLVAITSAAVEEPGNSIYRQYKIGQEAALRIVGLELTLLRPTMVLGPWQESGELQKLVARLKQGTVWIPNGGRMKFQPVDVEDVAKAAVAAVGRDEPVASGIVIAGPEGGTGYREFLIEARDRTGGSAKLQGVPIAPMRIASIFGGVLGKSTALKAQIAYYTHDHVYSLDSARAALNFTPRSYDETLTTTFGPPA